ncbi:type I phosphomannose isomerase catalytic subunit [Marinicrinis sediminis]|uniref:Mannose-6-phosphate isomerase n=1 Tax=Marinicrinis sediminis TaxID=1652465 RepID=A0ABW5R8T8_9BACL
MKPYPLKFEPEFKERVWGGRGLEAFGFDLPEGAIGEAWVIGDHANGTTAAANGPLAGKGLDEIRKAFGEEWLGENGAKSKNGRFPLLIKWLDCQDDLSIQVHPNDHYENLAEGELGKTEMWYIVHAEPGAKIIYGLQPEVDRDTFAKAIAEDRILDTLQEVEVQTGDTFYIPAGTVHALKAGVIVAEIQQNSDTTYRLYDYNRPGLDGKPRELHIGDSLNVTAYGDSGATRKQTDLSKAHEWLNLAVSPYFVTNKGLVDGAWTIEQVSGTFQIIMVCEGNGQIAWSGQDDADSLDLQPGDALLIPANLESYTLSGNMTVLQSHLPTS